MKTLKKFESFGPSNNTPSKEEINEKIKVIINNIIKCEKYFMMLKDTTEHVYESLINVYPKKVQPFINDIYSRDDMLGEFIDLLNDHVNNSEALSEIDEIILTIDNIKNYTDGNLDVILNQDATDDDDDDNDIYDDEGEEMDIHEDEIEDQLQRKPKKEDVYEFQRGDIVEILGLGNYKGSIGVVNHIKNGGPGTSGIEYSVYLTKSTVPGTLELSKLKPQNLKFIGKKNG